MLHISNLVQERQLAIPGILGGLGPLAHIEFERRLIQQNTLRGARCDQDHPLWLVISATPIPDRTQSLEGLMPDCTPWLIRYGSLLDSMGADFLIVTCNTAHAFYPAVQSQLRIPWIHLMDCTAKFIRHHWPTVQNIGVLATNGTLQAGLYSHSLATVNLCPILPNLRSPIQHQIMQSIYAPEWGIKASGVWVSDQALESLRRAIHWLADQGAELVIAGCTEISVGLSRLHQPPIPWIDPLEVIADLTLDLVFGCPQNQVQVPA
jgi:aspartate racemase